MSQSFDKSSWPVPFLIAVAIGSLGLGACVPAAIVGTAAAVGVVAAQERSIEGTAEDIQIRTEINHLWLQADEDLLYEVELQVQERRVLLSGAVSSPELRLKAVRLAWQAEGVKEVINEIEVTDKSSLSDYARDTRITTELRSMLLFDQEVRSVNYSIETVNQVIYLMGVAQDEAELQRVVDHARNVAYVRRVVSYVQMKADPERTT